jgi:hypothetical protein
MILRFIIALVCISLLYACADEAPKHQSEKYKGVYMDNSPRYGRFYKDPEGVMHSYRYMKATITNDSTIPLHVTIAFFEEAYEPIPANGKTFQVFFLADTMTPENQANDDFYRTEVMPFLDAGLGVPVMLHKVIAPKEACSINIGFLSEIGSKLDPLPITLFLKGHKHHFNSIPDSAVARALRANDPYDGLVLGLDFFALSGDSTKRYALIPCGSLSYSNR